MKHFFYPLVSLVFILFFGQTKGQNQDDFSDGDFSFNPTWQGDDSLFKVNAALQLQANGSIVGGEIQLATTIEVKEEMVWEIWMKLAFNPSTQNYARYFLVSDLANFKNASHSYYVQLGGSTGNTDSINLYKQSGTQRYCLIRGRVGTLGKTSNQFSLKIIRKESGEWQLFSDTSGNQNYQSEGVCIDTNTLVGSFTGIYFKYSSSNAQNLWADNWYAGKPIQDTLPPELIDIAAIDSDLILAQFNENIQLPQSNQIVLNQIFSPHKIELKQNELLLQFAQPFPKDSLIQIELKALSDLQENKLDTLIEIYNHEIQSGDLLLTEIMADPDPSIGLPACEYLEIYNNSLFILDTKGMFVEDASTKVPLPTLKLLPGEFLLICSHKDSSALKPFGRLCSVANFPSLNNSGDAIKLLDKKSKELHSVVYDLSWYQDMDKANGGYSLEMVNPKQLCKKQLNWKSSESALGGTPGNRNSDWNTQKESVPPHILSVEIINKNTLQVMLSEPVSFYGPPERMVQIVGKTLAHILPDPLQSNRFKALFLDSFEHQKSYALLLDSIGDCAGNLFRQQMVLTYQEVRKACMGDVLIHEIYFDVSKKGAFPNTPFIELYNKQDYAIDLNGFRLCDNSSEKLLGAFILQPKQYLILCALPQVAAFEKNAICLGLPSFPSLSLSDCVRLKDSSGYLIHAVCYEQDWLKKDAPVYSCSIEMIDTANPCGGSENWKACKSLNGATPGLPNSTAGKSRDHSPPQLWRVYTQNKQQLVLSFSEPVDSSTCQFAMIPSLAIDRLYYVPEQINKITLALSQGLDSATDYQVVIESLQDCAGNQHEPQISPVFQLAKVPQAGNIQINEILFNPKVGGIDFIELFNTSNHTFDLTETYLFGINERGQKENEQAFGESGIMLLPGEHLVLSAQCDLLLQQFPHARSEALVEHEIPNMPDDQGCLLLVNRYNETLDSVCYHSSMHISFLNNQEGVSLEKINPYLHPFETTNWSSAAEEAGFGSPTESNTQYKLSQGEGKFSAAVAYFSPDGDGQDDLMTFVYSNGEGTAIGTLSIFNQGGEKVKTICESKILATQGEIHWNGENEAGKKAGIGIYLAYFTLLDPSGREDRYKLSFSLLSK